MTPNTSHASRRRIPRALSPRSSDDFFLLTVVEAFQNYTMAEISVRFGYHPDRAARLAASAAGKAFINWLGFVPEIIGKLATVEDLDVARTVEALQWEREEMELMDLNNAVASLKGYTTSEEISKLNACLKAMTDERRAALVEHRLVHALIEKAKAERAAVRAAKARAEGPRSRPGPGTAYLTMVPKSED